MNELCKLFSSLSGPYLSVINSLSLLLDLLASLALSFFFPAFSLSVFLPLDLFLFSSPLLLYPSLPSPRGSLLVSLLTFAKVNVIITIWMKSVWPVSFYTGSPHKHKKIVHLHMQTWRHMFENVHTNRNANTKTIPNTNASSVNTIT